MPKKSKAKAAPKKAAPKKAAPKKTQTTLTGKGKGAAAKKAAKLHSDDDDSGDNFEDDSVMSHTPPKKATKGAAPKKAGSKPLADVENESFMDDAADEPPKPSTAKGTDATEKYQKVCPPCQPPPPLARTDGF